MKQILRVSVEILEMPCHETMKFAHYICIAKLFDFLKIVF